MGVSIVHCTDKSETKVPISIHTLNEEKDLLNDVSKAINQRTISSRKITKQKTSIIIPTYNEKDCLQYLLDKIEETIQKYNIQAEIIIVDDNSPDGTGKVADSLAETNKNIEVIHHPKKLGLGSAYKTAFKKATGEAIITMDADLSHDPEELADLLKALRNHKVDVVIGSRYINGGRIKDWSLRRRLISKIGNLLARYVLGLKIRDLTSGYRVYRCDVIESILSEIDSDGFFFQVEALYYAIKMGFKVEEHQICFVERKNGKSNLNLSECLIFFSALFRLKNSRPSGGRDF
jgi:dolichol-phosphate mannosyltransferase